MVSPVHSCFFFQFYVFSYARTTYGDRCSFAGRFRNLGLRANYFFTEKKLYSYNCIFCFSCASCKAQQTVLQYYCSTTSIFQDLTRYQIYPYHCFSNENIETNLNIRKPENIYCKNYSNKTFFPINILSVSSLPS